MNLQEQIMKITVIIQAKTVIPSTIQNFVNQDMQNNNSILWCCCEMWFYSLRKEYKLQVFINTVPRMRFKDL
jgi:acetone carboxylase gamma subunit